MKKIFTLTLALSAMLTAGAAPALTLAKKSGKADVTLDRAAHSFVLPASEINMTSRADDIAGDYYDGAYQVVTDGGNRVIGRIVSPVGGFSMVPDPEVENGYVLKGLFQNMFFATVEDGTVNDIKAVFDPATNVLSINPGQVLTVMSDATFGDVDLQIFTCDSQGRYDFTLPVELGYEYGRFLLNSNGVFFGQPGASENEDPIAINAYLDNYTAWIPNGEMTYYSYEEQREITNPVYGLYTSGHIFIYNFGEADQFYPVPFLRQDNDTQAVFRSILGEEGYHAAANIVQYFPSEGANTIGSFYLTAVGPNPDEEGAYLPLMHGKYDFYVAGEIVKNTPTECVISLPDCGLYSEQDTPWDIYLGCQISFNPSAIAGIESVASDVDNANATVIYYNLQGVRVDNPQGGIFIRRQGTEATKVLVK